MHINLFLDNMVVCIVHIRDESFRERKVLIESVLQ